MYKLIITKNELEVKIALFEDDILVEFFIERARDKNIETNIYKAKVVKKMDNIQAIFVDIGTEEAFLNIEKTRNFSELNKELMVQVVADTKNDKAIKLSTDYSLKGNYLILLPSSKNVTISKKIKTEEEERLKNIFKDVDYGLIIRTAAENIPEEKLYSEYDALCKKWKEILNLYERANVGNLIYKQSFVEKVLLDLDLRKIDEIIVDSEELYQEISKISLYESLAKKIKLHHKEKELFSYYNIDKEVERALSKNISLSSGINLVIEETEALVSIDVNSSINTHLSSLAINIEAAKEIFRQIRLRNLAGIIVIDFINMYKKIEREKFLASFKELLKKDRQTCEFISFSKIGLIEMTRKKSGKSLSEYFLDCCSLCSGRAYEKNLTYLAINLLSELKEACKDRDIATITVAAKKDLVNEIKSYYIDIIKKYEKDYRKTIEIKSVDSYQKTYNIDLKK